MRPAVLLLVLFSFSPFAAAQVRVDVGVAAGQQSFESPVGSQFVVSPEVLLSRGRLGVYYALDSSGLGSPGTLLTHHVGGTYRWPLGKNLSLSAGAGPSYVSSEHVGGELAWHAQAELAWRTRRLEWFAKARHSVYDLSGFRETTIDPSGPALLAGVRVTLSE